MDPLVIEQVVEEIRGLPRESQWRVLEFARSLAQPARQGVPGRRLLRLAGSIPADDVQAMREAIDQGCERIDSREW